MNLFQTLKEAVAHLGQDHVMCFGPATRFSLGHLFHPSLMACSFYRFARAFDRSGWTFWARFISTLGRWITHCDIHYRAHLEPGVLFPHGLGVVIGEGVVVQKRCSIFQHCSLGSSEGKEGSPSLEEGVNLYPNTVVAGPIHIGEYSRIGPNVYLTGSVPKHTRVTPGPSSQKPHSP